MRVLKNKIHWNIETIKSIKVDFSPNQEKKYKQSAEIKGNSITFIGESSIVNQQTFVYVVNKVLGLNPIHSIYPFLKNCHKEYIISKLDDEATKPITAIFQVTICVILNNGTHEIVKDVTGYFKYNVFYQHQEFPYGDFVDFCVNLINSTLNAELDSLKVNRYARIDISWSGWSPTFLITRSISPKYSMKRTKSYSLPMLSWSSRARIIRMLSGFKPVFMFTDTQDVGHYYYEPKLTNEDKDKIKENIYNEFIKVIREKQYDIYTLDDAYAGVLAFYKKFNNFLTVENIEKLTFLVSENILQTKDKDFFENGMNFLNKLKRLLIESRETPLSKVVEATFHRVVIGYINRIESFFSLTVDELKKGKLSLVDRYFKKSEILEEPLPLKIYTNKDVEVLSENTNKLMVLEGVVYSKD